jgi:integrase
MPGTRKDKSLNWMPSRVYRGKSAFEWHPAGGGCVRLCALDSTPAQVWTAFEAAEAAHGKRPKYTVGDLAREYFASRTFLRRRPRTQQDYQDCWKVLGRVFEDADARLVQPKHVREYMDKRGTSSEVRANREKAVLHNIFAHAFERSIVKQNPVVGVKSFPEKARDRYIEDEELADFRSRSPEPIQIFIDFAYNTAARGQDIRAIMMGDLREEGIYIRQQKTGKKQIKAWTPELRDVVTRAIARRKEILARKGSVDCLYLILTEHGMPYSESGLKTAWARNRAAIEEETQEKIGWTFHDIKAKSISDHDGDKQQFSGHKSRGQVESYNRKTEVVPSAQSDIFTQNP